jgi:hypothetical protein
LSLDRVESDQPTQQAIETLVELSRDSLDMIAWALSELLDRLAKVRTLFLKIEIEASRESIILILTWSIFFFQKANRYANGASDDRSSPIPTFHLEGAEYDHGIAVDAEFQGRGSPIIGARFTWA